jgi:nucleotide-binding universal stress UspA family protein
VTRDQRRPEDVFEDFAEDFIRRHPGPENPSPAISLDPILVATDFSAESVRALEYAWLLARRFDAEILVVHAEPALAVLPGTDLAERRRLAAERALGHAVEELREAGCRARALLRPGDPVAEIVNAATAERAGLVLMGTRGRGGLPHLLLGSVAERVVRSAPCPVLTVRCPPGEAPPPG